MLAWKKSTGPITKLNSISYQNVLVNAGSRSRREDWVMVGPEIIFTLAEEATEPVPDESLFNQGPVELKKRKGKKRETPEGAIGE
jgi:hypothetical protein